MTRPVINSKNENLFHSNNFLDLRNLKNISKLSSSEQKSLSILVVANMELSSLNVEDRSSTIDALIKSFNESLPSFKQFDDLFNSYYSEKNITRKNELFKQVKPLESIAMYFSEIALIFNTVPKTTAITKKAFAFNLLLHWFNIENTHSVYFNFIDNFSFQDEINKIIEETKEIEKLEKNIKNELYSAFDNSIQIVEYIKKFLPRIYIPKKKGFRTNKK
ncbi:hypothetical protein [Aliarcobacter butzleri]|uniref:hypothetical protein n=1 Tax=Aliarcobacter butzleri TaxID=28197 RepID=UPI003450A523